MDYLNYNTNSDITIRIFVLMVMVLLPCILFAQIGSGSKYKIHEINYSGNESFTAKELNKNIKLSKTKFFAAQRLSRRMIQTDKLILKTFYLKSGFLNCTVKDSIFIDRDNNVDIFFAIDEGVQFKLRSINIEENEIIDDEHFIKWMGLNLGDAYNPIQVRDGLKEIKIQYENRGKPFALINDSLHIENSDIDLVLKVQENQTMKIEDITIKNNQKVEKEVIQRELVIKSGDVYSKKKIETSKKYLLNLGLFNTVNINISDIDTVENEIDLVIYVREQDMRYWEFNTGIIQAEGQGTEVMTKINLSALWRHKNLLNKAKGLSANSNIGINPYDFSSRPDFTGNITYMEPWLIGLRSTTMIRFFVDDLKADEYDFNKFGIETALIINPDKRNYLKTGFEVSGISNEFKEIDIAIDSSIIKDIEKEKERAVLLDYSRDRRNDFLFPSKGHLFTFSGKIASNILGGTENYLQFETSYSEYFRIYKNFVFAYRGKFGYLTPYGSDKTAPEYEKYYLGGATSLRGWENQRFLTKSSEDGSEIGDRKRLKVLTNFELRFPIYWLLGGELFFDGGNLVSDIKSLRSQQYMWNFGIGLTLATPLGPARVEFARPLTIDNAKWIPQFAISYAF
ncbi:MAG: BamA/TamA family outer membrane protein [Candidatus Marinimicrobia bacterium]|nr:BamA/TamA family outer membrane protein [Candidatus Neomarinimicrobiota bacterium]